MRTNTAKAKLKAGETIFGCFVRYPDAGLVELFAMHGWDFLVFDGEHGTMEPRDCEQMVRAAELRGVTSIARVTTNQPPVILRFMDTGAQGLHVPWVNSGAEAEAAVRAVKYFPRGVRGLAGVRAADYSQTIPLSEYVQQANAETMIVVQVETVQAVERLAEIVAVNDLDVVFIGPNDLSHSMGFPGQPQHPKVQEVIQHIADTVLKSRAALGIMVQNAPAARQWRERGARYITIGMEAVLNVATREYLASARG